MEEGRWSERECEGGGSEGGRGMNGVEVSVRVEGVWVEGDGGSERECEGGGGWRECKRRQDQQCDSCG